MLQTAVIRDDVRQGNFSPNIIYQGEVPVEFSSVPLTMMEGGDYRRVDYPTVSSLLERYYSEKNAVSRIHQKSTDLRKIISNALERNYKKYDLQKKQLKDTEKREKFRIYGELLNTYGYGLSGGEKNLTCIKSILSGEKIYRMIKKKKNIYIYIMRNSYFRHI